MDKQDKGSMVGIWFLFLSIVLIFTVVYLVTFFGDDDTVDWDCVDKCIKDVKLISEHNNFTYDDLTNFHEQYGYTHEYYMILYSIQYDVGGNLDLMCYEECGGRS